MKAPLWFFLLCFSLYASAEVDPNSITKLHIVVMNHLDVGFIAPPFNEEVVGYSVNVINVYFNRYFPLAIDMAEQLENNKETDARFVYTTHPWLVDLYLDCNESGFPFVPEIGVTLKCPNAGNVTRFENAIRKGIISWHAFPFNAEAEAYDTGLFSSALSVAKRLSDRFNLPQPTTMSQRDVPGTTCSAIPLLKKNGVHTLTIGVNPGSAPADVQPVSMWKDPVSGQSICLLYHKGGYSGDGVGDAVMVPGLDEALIAHIRGDNEGPGSVDEIIQLWKQQKQQFPNAKIVASNWDAFTNKLQDPKIIDKLPTFSKEMGDTWIYGIAADPHRLGLFRGFMRARSACVESKQCDVNDITMKRFDRLLMKLGEHTSGVDVKTYLHDWVNWSNKDFQKARSGSNYVHLENSWKDHRSYLYAAYALLKNHTLVSLLDAERAQFRPIKPNVQGWQKIEKVTDLISVGKFQIGFDDNGSINRLFDTVSGRTYADSSHPLGLFQYSTYDATDYDNFIGQYSLQPDQMWIQQDFGKQNVSLGKPIKADYNPQLKELYRKGSQLQLRMTLPALPHQMAGAPSQIFLNVSLGAVGNTDQIQFRLQWFDKVPTRLPEALFFQFNPKPQQKQGNWIIEKLGQNINPYNIVNNGSFHLHSTKYVQLDSVTVESLDAGLLVVGKPTPFPTPLNNKFQLADYGMSFCLYNNIWGTNYVMWYPYIKSDSTSSFRFTISLGK